MIPRYAHGGISQLFSDEQKVARWDAVELAVIAARVELDLTTASAYEEIAAQLKAHPCDIRWWHTREAETKHDLTAYIDERLRHIPHALHAEWHKDMTSYDTEDAAATRALLDAAELVHADVKKLIQLLRSIALQYRYTPMLERTHGQWAKLRSFGGRVLTWLKPLSFALSQLEHALLSCQYSRISGAIGNYGGELSPQIEQLALRKLKLVPFYGATQILPRIVQAPLAQALRLVAEALAQIATDFRLGSRSGCPLWHEPFGKKQKGSSAMPHKKNPINTEQMGGMLNLVRGYESSILASMQTWEGRAIEQSCVERTAWPDLFHAVLRMTSVMNRVISGMVVYPDNMVREIGESRGTYASDEAKNMLARECGKRDVPFETAYRIMQAASFIAFKPNAYWHSIRTKELESLTDADLYAHSLHPAQEMRGIDDIIAKAELVPVDEIDVTAEHAETWNALLRRIFESDSVRNEWSKLFAPSYLLKNEGFLFASILNP